MPQILKKYPDAILKIVGDGQEKSALILEAKRLGVEKNVQFLGPLEHETQLPSVMGSADVFLAPKSGGFSLIEAMSCGLPSVCGEFEWSSEVIKSGENGFLVNPEDIREIAEKTCLLLSDSKLRFRLGKNARLFVEKKFSFKTWAEREMQFYEDVLNRQRRL